ncbi:MAG TPA: UMP kinase [Clostridiales bacterium]|nr:UMP kinase [Clostridiales bacterium]
MTSKYKRVLLKLSGEALAGDKKTGFDEGVCIEVAKQVKQLLEQNIQVAIVIGGGNFWRGRSSNNIDRTKADQIGMLATVMNCIYVSEIFRSLDIDTNILTPFTCGSMSKLFSKDEAVLNLEDGKVVFLAGGTGHPYFSTDTSTVLRAIELEAEIILMAKAIDGVYDSDPSENPQAKKYEQISLQETLDKQLGVVDLSATVLALENKMPMLIFALEEEKSIINAVTKNFNGTTITI